MSSDDNSKGDSVEINRRAVLRGAATSAVGAVAFAGGASAATQDSDVDPDKVIGPQETIEPDRIVEDINTVQGVTESDCYTDYTCKSEPCGGQQGRVYKRECCRRGGGYICDEYSYTSDCC